MSSNHNQMSITLIAVVIAVLFYAAYAVRKQKTSPGPITEQLNSTVSPTITVSKQRMMQFSNPRLHWWNKKQSYKTKMKK